MKTALVLFALFAAGCKCRPPAPHPHAPGEPAPEYIPPQSLPIPERMPKTRRAFEMSVDAPVADPSKARMSAKLTAEF